MIQPSASQLFDALDATWPAARTIAQGPWLLREGLGGGQRVSSATANGAFTDPDIAEAEQGMKTLNQHPLFMIRPDDAALDTALQNRGYDIVDPVAFYVARTDSLLPNASKTMTIPAWPPLAAHREFWTSQGINTARQSVMERCAGTKTAILARSGDMLAGGIYVANQGAISMLHALEVAPSERRKRIGSALMHAAAEWAQTAGADWLTLAVIKSNDAAIAFYQNLGMKPLAAYHYRRAPGHTT